ncbi:septum formation family protein [Salinibacterium sp. NSLL150]|uniref:septum formation family protein n=1 Tax=unclassified Salinibacterium TaxID=2632331 RepID=UPI0018CE29D6|nr:MULTISPECIES: septum formation family protein [unclassified Salinibacterium]MBH0100255.1 septum formation family protein [Salinibacterium sp. NSLL35]MBH0103009.1 septum formation family protein [Salinibacterium sp. NSLL150]MBH0105769.1 septum formation family protein [Salinibacterium sp. NSLL16]MBH0108529.1 septum formation family protein [Salinibacterium sp. NSLL17]MBH0111304.1 septum formation family protein [Salinibacterium sp. NG22]
MTTENIWRRTLAIATIAVAAVALSGCSILDQVTNQISDAVDPGAGTTQDIFSLVIGDCEVGNQDGGEVSSTKTVDCAEPHDAEVYAASYMAEGDFPGDSAIEDQATADCYAEFGTFIGADYEDSVYDFSWYYPTEGSWSEGDREILCLVYDPSGNQISGSLAGAAE